MPLLATITDHEQCLVTPALYRINVQIILSSTVDDPKAFARRITYLLRDPNFVGRLAPARPACVGSPSRSWSPWSSHAHSSPGTNGLSTAALDVLIRHLTATGHVKSTVRSNVTALT